MLFVILNCLVSATSRSAWFLNFLRLIGYAKHSSYAGDVDDDVCIGSSGYVTYCLKLLLQYIALALPKW
jgi:hypothetical protein